MNVIAPAATAAAADSAAADGLLALELLQEDNILPPPVTSPIKMTAYRVLHMSPYTRLL